MGLQMRGSNLKKLQEKNEKMQSELLQNEQLQSAPQESEKIEPANSEPQLSEQPQSELPSREELEEKIVNLELENSLLKKDKEMLIFQIDKIEETMAARVEAMGEQVKTLTTALTSISSAEKKWAEDMDKISKDVGGLMYRRVDEAARHALKEYNQQVTEATDAHRRTINNLTSYANSTMDRVREFLDNMKWRVRLLWLSIICNIGLAGYIVYTLVDWSVITG